jgi:guanylate kinase
MSNFRIYCIVGPSGVGKTTTMNELLKRNDNLQRVTTYTTRPHRDDEVDGVDYHYISHKQYLDMLANGMFVAWTHIHGHLYGTAAESFRQIWQAGKQAIIILDVSGKDCLKRSAYWPVTVPIILLPPSDEEMQRRLSLRQNCTPKEVQLRLSENAELMKHAHEFEHQIPPTTDPVRMIEAIINKESVSL